MGANEDLREVAAALAKRARGFTTTAPGPADEHLDHAAVLARGARDALEAARLVDVPAGPLVTALGVLAERVGSDEISWALTTQQPDVALDAVGDLVEHLRREVAIGAAVQHGYVVLDRVLRGLFTDFSAGDSETARRYASRIESALVEAKAAIDKAKGDGEDG